MLFGALDIGIQYQKQQYSRPLLYWIFNNPSCINTLIDPLDCVRSHLSSVKCRSALETTMLDVKMHMVVRNWNNSETCSEAR
jgi:hypothetical protein